MSQYVLPSYSKLPILVNLCKISLCLCCSPMVIWPYQGQGYNSASGHFVWLVRSPGTVSHCTFVLHLHYHKRLLIFDHKSTLTGTGNRSSIDSSDIIDF